jgi:Tc5 transposase DNA-binding domain
MDDGSRSPIKRSKGKVPDIEKALANWARNYTRQGFILTDAMIKEKANFFATTCTQDGKQKILTPSWLEKFKQKNNLSGSKSRKNSTDTVASDGGESISRLQSPTDSHIKSTGVSPISPTGLMPSPLSPGQSYGKLKKEPSDSFFDFSMDQSKHSHSQSTTSLDTIPSLSAGLASPTSPLISGSPLTPILRSSRLPSISSAVSRPRSQTFPLLSSDAEGNGTGSSKVSKSGSRSVSVVTSPLDLEQQRQNNEDNIFLRDDHHSTTIKRNPSTPDLKSPTSMQPPPVPVSRSAVGSPVSSSSPIGSSSPPTQDEARRALELVMSYIQSQPAGLGLQASDYIMMGNLMEKLELVHGQSGTSMILSKLHRIDEDGDADIDVDVVDVDVSVDAPHVPEEMSIQSMT